MVGFVAGFQDSQFLYMLLEAAMGGEFFTYMQARLYPLLPHCLLTVGSKDWSLRESWQMQKCVVHRLFVCDPVGFPSRAHRAGVQSQNMWLVRHCRAGQMPSLSRLRASTPQQWCWAWTTCSVMTLSGGAMQNDSLSESRLYSAVCDKMR